MSRIAASLLVLAGGASYGLLGSFVKMAYDAGFTPQDVTSSQFFFALMMLAALSAFHWKTIRNLTRSELRLLFLLGVFSAGTTVFYYTSLHYLPASLAIVLLFQFSWIIMLIDYLVVRRKPTFAKWLSLILVIIGTLLAVNVWKTDWRQVSALGLLLGLLSSATYSAFLYWNEKSRSQTPAVVNSFMMGAASVLAICFVFPPNFLWNGTLGQGLWMWALLIGCFGQVFPPILFNKGIPVVGGTLAGLLASIELPVAVVAASILLREPVGAIRWLGIGLIVTGIVVAELLDRVPANKLVKAHE
ncbi:EamA family transporter [Effusibacillus pohliae]|uniref:EamA family transporter n=1 Tax=Effusibacillus pohliae TaxID=232270 RepID=UPI00037D6989|nr:EamA family transporter [Effusibacillus pohliae]